MEIYGGIKVRARICEDKKNKITCQEPAIKSVSKISKSVSKKGITLIAQLNCIHYMYLFTYCDSCLLASTSNSNAFSIS